tara:strand:- start:758 stop:994 length:237 start_codon:yes stop_codon:yes gene_type:complete
MFLTLNFFIPITRNIKTRAFIDPAQYDTEINSRHVFKTTKSKSKSVKIKHTTLIDPDQFDIEENIERHILHDTNTKPN